MVDKRDALLDAAERAILAEGYTGASTRRIALEAGVPLSLLHYYFGGKEGLLVALVERARDRIRAAARSQTVLKGPGAALALTQRAFLDESTTARLILELAVAASHSPTLRQQLRRLYAESIAALGAMAAPLLAASGHATARTMRPEAVGSLLIAAGFGLALQRKLGVEPEAASEAFAALGRLVLGADEV